MKRESIFWKLYGYVYDLVIYIPSYRLLLEDIIEELIQRKPSNLLDVGCGTGNLIRQATDRVPDLKITGVDASTSMLSRLLRKMSGTQLTVVMSDLNHELPKTIGEYDFIVAMNSIYALNNPELVVDRLIKKLSDGGMLMIINPSDRATFFTTYMTILRESKSLKKVSSFLVTIPLFFFNSIIGFKARNKVYYFHGEKKWREILSKHSLREINVTDAAMDSIIIKIVK